jgi:branched-chain amino acid transport system ATP-binding protein
VAELLAELGLEGVAHRPAARLPFGTMKRVELARALASRPRLLLLDEPAGGLSLGEVGELAGLIRRIRKSFELTILLVEHHMNLVWASPTASTSSTSVARSRRARRRRCSATPL